MDDYQLQNTPLNLAAMEIKHMVHVRALFADKSLMFVAAVLGLTRGQFDKKCKHYGIRLPKKTELKHAYYRRS